MNITQVLIYDVDLVTSYNTFQSHFGILVCSVLTKRCNLLKMLKKAFLQLFPKFFCQFLSSESGRSEKKK